MYSQYIKLLIDIFVVEIFGDLTRVFKNKGHNRNSEISTSLFAATHDS